MWSEATKMTLGEILRYVQDFGKRFPLLHLNTPKAARWGPASLAPPERFKINDPPVSLPRRLRVEPVDQFFSCQVLQLLRLESSISRKVAWADREIRSWKIGAPVRSSQARRLRSTFSCAKRVPAGEAGASTIADQLTSSISYCLRVAV